MTAEEKVKQVYAEAWYRIAGPRRSMIRAGEMVIVECHHRNKRRAWADAWRNIQAARGEQG